MRLFVHYTQFDEAFDPHELAAAYGTGLLDRDGSPIATTPQVPGYVLDPCVARYTTNPLNVATIGADVECRRNAGATSRCRPPFAATCCSGCWPG